MLRSPQNLGIIHFIGIGGIGMSGIAEILHQSGYHVQGSDISQNKNIERLTKLGIKIFFKPKTIKYNKYQNSSCIYSNF